MSDLACYDRARTTVMGADSSSTFTFGDFELDCRARELKKRGRKLRVQQQPIQILSMLVAAPGEVVTREELRDAVWAQHTHVDFDRGINKAINRLRQVMGDVSQRPRFIETVPRRGYRFLAAVTRLSPPARMISPEVRETLLKARHFSGKRTAQDLPERRLLPADDRARSRLRGCMGGPGGSVCGAGHLRAAAAARDIPGGTNGGRKSAGAERRDGAGDHGARGRQKVL